jgi:ubiquinone/menaquinone biosynthesis C-methylase UbiE
MSNARLTDGTADHYLIRGGLDGRVRLRVLARVMWPSTRELLARVGVPEDARCLDVGCGGGDVTIPLARLAPRGQVVGTDVDEVKLELARAEALAAGVENVEFRLEDVTEPPRRAEWFDLVYARFLLTHLPDPAEVVARLVARLQPGGVLVVEDIDCSGHFCHPESAAFRRYVELYTMAARARGGDPGIGPRLPSLLAEAGLDVLGMHVVQPAGFHGDVTIIAPLTLEAIGDAAVGAGLATAEELARLLDDLSAFARTPGTVSSIPRVVQAWGRRPAGGRR